MQAPKDPVRPGPSSCCGLIVHILTSWHPAGVIEPDFSTCLDFPVALKAYSVYRNQALGSFLQRNGILCVPNVRCEPGLPWMLDGTPRRSAIAIGARAAVKKPSDREALMRAVRFAVEVLEPTEIIWYGSTSYG